MTVLKHLNLPWRHREEVELSSFINLGARSGRMVTATPQPLDPYEWTSTHCIGGWLRPRAGLNGYGKISPPPQFDFRTIQLTSSCHTDYAILGHPIQRIHCLSLCCDIVLHSVLKKHTFISAYRQCEIHETHILIILQCNAQETYISLCM